jgi:hypothetical protein
MCNSFDTVDEKTAETEFFLQRMSEIELDPFAFNCYLSAFLAAARTTTLALQRFKHIPGFDQWYESHRESLGSHRLAQFFLRIRNEHAHGGRYPVSGGRFHQGKAEYYFHKSQSEMRTDVPTEDVVSACREYFVLLLEIVYDCYVALGVHIDPQQYYTKEYFATQGKTIDDAELEVHGWVCMSLIEEGFDEDDRWIELRVKVGECKINHLFHSYLGKTTPQPEIPERYHDFEYTPEEKGWVHIPAGFESIEDYMNARLSREDHA